MQFRFNPRQMGVFGKRTNNNAPSHGDLYDDKISVSQNEINHVKNSKVTPYRHKPNNTKPLPESSDVNAARERINALLGTQLLNAVNTDALLRQNAETIEAQVDEAAPTHYTHEHKSGVFSKFAELFKIKDKDSLDFPLDSDNSALNDSLDTDEDGKPLFKDDIISLITSELDRRRTERLNLELQWQLNSNFYDGNQYCDINAGTKEIAQYPRCHKWEQREIFNRIAPLIETRVANLKKINYAMIVKPASNEADDYQKAKVSTAILRHAQQKGGFNTKKDSLILWNEICGSCFWLAWWDSAKGEIFANSNDAFNRNICEGDIDFGLLTPHPK